MGAWSWERLKYHVFSLYKRCEYIEQADMIKIFVPVEDGRGIYVYVTHIPISEDVAYIQVCSGLGNVREDDMLDFLQDVSNRTCSGAVLQEGVGMQIRDMLLLSGTTGDVLHRSIESMAVNGFDLALKYTS